MKPFLFIDFYKTLSFGYLWHLVPLEFQKQIQLLLFSDLQKESTTADKWMRGLMTSEEVNLFVSQELQIDYDELWGLFVRSSETIGVSAEALELITQLQGKYTTVLMTDNMDSFTRFTVPAYNLEITFNNIINSADVGIRKSDKDGKIFKLITEDFVDSILIDDTESMYSLFRSWGGTAYRVTEEDSLEKHLQSLV